MRELLSTLSVEAVSAALLAGSMTVAFRSSCRATVVRLSYRKPSRAVAPVQCGDGPGAMDADSELPIAAIRSYTWSEDDSAVKVATAAWTCQRMPTNPR